MEFFLPFKSPDYPFIISYHDKILFIGSCFSEEIGNKMANLKFDVLQNPNGILYNPVNIADALSSYIENKPFDNENLLELNGLWHSWKHHSVFSGINKNEVLQKIVSSQLCAHDFLKKANVLIITLGTAFSYQLKTNKESVVNCHKAPAGIFEKKLLTIDEIVSKMLRILNAIEEFNPVLKIIFNISPVKHVKDGVIENNRSKARLIEAVYSIIEEKRNTFYFPSYELVNDVLRDYRFYKNDLVHPNENAIDFVFEKFSISFFDNTTKEIRKEIEKILSAVNHKPFLKESDAYQKFIASQLLKINKIELEYPFINLSEEKNILKNAKYK